MLRRLMFRRLYSTKPWTYAEASRWCKTFSKEQIPKNELKISVSRSSGPGGQNVNKGKQTYNRYIPKCSYEFLHLFLCLVNTKVDIRLGIQDATWIPEYARIKILQEVSQFV
jgi:peptidyl-tRNA hydrolase ICT1